MGISVEWSMSQANNSESIDPSVGSMGDNTYKASGDMVYNVYYTPPSSSTRILLATIKFYVRAYYGYSTSSNRYEFRTDLYAYRSYYNSNYNVGYISFPTSDIYVNGTSHNNINVYGDNYNTATKISNISENYTRVAYSSTFTYSGSRGSYTNNYAQFTIKYGDTSSLGSSQDTYASRFPNTTISYTGNKYTCRFTTGGTPSSYTDQEVYWGKSPSNPGTPYAPSDIQRTISVNFIPGKGTSATLTSTGNVIDTWTANGWSPSISSGITGDTDFYYGFTRKYNGTTVLIPLFSTTTGKPEASGYTFNYWKDSKGSNIGSEPNTQTSKSFGEDTSETSFNVEASWNTNDYTFTIYPKVMYNNQLIDLPGSSPKRVTLKYTENKIVDALGLIDYTGYLTPETLVNPDTGETIERLSGDMTSTLEWNAIYTLITNTVFLNPNGGITPKGDSETMRIDYNILDNPISLRDDEYVPTKYNTTFVGWLYNNQYISAIVPSEETIWPNSRTFKADYIPMGKFIFHKDTAGKGHWYGVINCWVYDNGAWRGGIPPIEQTLINTNTVGYIFKNGAWKIEYGKTELPLD